MALVVVSATAGLGAYLIAQGFLGALPHQAVATWAALSLVLLAIGATTAGLIALIGAPGLGLGVVLMVLVGNPFSGATSAPELLPAPVGTIGQWLPPGAGANLIRSTAYFDGHGASGHLIVLIVWDRVRPGGRRRRPPRPGPVRGPPGLEAGGGKRAGRGRRRPRLLPWMRSGARTTARSEEWF